jgi:hypothetical protein
MSDTLIAQFLEDSSVLGYDALWNGVNLPTCHKNLPPSLDFSFTELCWRWKQEAFLKGV